MGDHETAGSRAPETIIINVLRVRNLRGQKGDNLTALVKVEFGEKSLGESPKVDCTAEGPAEINYNASLSVHFDDLMQLDEIAYKPALLTVVEVLPKEKKDKKEKKEEKTAPLGQCTVDLFPLLNGETKHKYTLTVNPLLGSSIENLPPEHPKPEVDVCISVTEPLLSEAQLKEHNLMSMTVESLYSPPDSWSPSGPQYVYTAAAPVPITAERENVIVFTSGQLKPGVEKEAPNRQKRWAVPSNAQANAVFIPDSYISGDAVEDEDGDYKSKEDRDHRTVSEQDKNRITWNTERRCHMEPSGAKSMQDKIAKTRYWPVEIMRLPLPSGGKGKKEDETVSFHGVVYVNMAPLLYPGVKRIRGAYKVHAFNESEVHEKCLRKGSLAEEATKITNSLLSRTAMSPFPGKAAKAAGKDEKKDPKKQKTPGAALPDEKQSDTGSEGDGQPTVNLEGQQYVEAKSYILLEINLSRPLVPKRPPEELAKRVAEYIPPRPLFPKRTNGAQRAVEDYHSHIGQVANLILDEFREHFSNELSAPDAEPQSHSAMEARRQKLIYHLNSTGKYFAFKEQLKYAVIKIVREKYLKTTNFASKEDLQAFLSELYVYLIDQMHVGLSKVLSLEDQTPIPEPLTDSAQLKHFAREAEVNQNFDLAAKYYQERIARDRNDPDHWLDYGTFCLYINDLTKAEECFKECVSIDQRHMQGLLLYGVVCTMQDKHDIAETFFEAATSVDPKSILAWTMLGLFYDGIGNEIGAEMALMEANKLNVAAAAASMRIQQEAVATAEAKDNVQESRDEEEVPAIVAPDGSMRGDTESQHQAKVPPSPTISQASDVSKSKQGTARLSEKRLSVGSKKQAGLTSQMRSKESVTGSRPGSLHARSSSITPADANVAAEATAATAPGTQEEAPPPREATPVPSTTIFMFVVEWLLEAKAMPFTERALAHHLLEPLGGPSADFHIALARLKLQKNELEEADKNLQEALQFDFNNPDAWGLIGHLKYLSGNTEAAKDCYERTLSFINDPAETHSIYLRLASIYLQEARFPEAKKTFLMACKRSPTCVSWLGVGIACYWLNELSEAEDALSEANILNNSDPVVWGHLSLVCLKTGRQLEAEQAYKYAVKLNLQDQSVLEELHKVQQEVGFGNPQL